MTTALVPDGIAVVVAGVLTAGMPTLATDVVIVTAVAATLTVGLATLATGAAALTTGVTALTAGVEMPTSGLETATIGVAALTTGAASLITGAPAPTATVALTEIFATGVATEFDSALPPGRVFEIGVTSEVGKLTAFTVLTTSPPGTEATSPGLELGTVASDVAAMAVCCTVVVVVVKNAVVVWVSSGGARLQENQEVIPLFFPFFFGMCSLTKFWTTDWK